MASRPRATIDDGRCLLTAAREIIGGTAGIEKRYYISCLPAVDPGHARAVDAAARHLWGIERQVNGAPAFAMDHDIHRARIGDSAPHLALVPKGALNLLKLDQTEERGIQAGMTTAGWDSDQLLHLLCLARWGCPGR